MKSNCLGLVVLALGSSAAPAQASDPDSKDR
jgi:hypothetical protein